MKKILVLALMTFTLCHCGEELEFNSPAFEAKKDGNLWEAFSFTAAIDNAGVLTITAADRFETITLVVNSATIGAHDVRFTASSASLLDVNSVSWSTNNTPDPSVQLYPAEGVITLTSFGAAQTSVSGTFAFNAFNASGLSSVNFNEGIFHNIPLSGATITAVKPKDIECETQGEAIVLAYSEIGSATKGAIQS